MKLLIVVVIVALHLHNSSACLDFSYGPCTSDSQCCHVSSLGRELRCLLQCFDGGCMPYRQCLYHSGVQDDWGGASSYYFDIWLEIYLKFILKCLFFVCFLFFKCRLEHWLIYYKINLCSSFQKITDKIFKNEKIKNSLFTWERTKPATFQDEL